MANVPTKKGKEVKSVGAGRQEFLHFPGFEVKK
jgi:hypothetical protein